MIDIKAIIESETRNTNFITLYKYQSGWRAYEQSAFHLITIFNYDRVGMYDDCIYAEVDTDMQLLQSKAVCKLRLLTVDGEKIAIECDKLFTNYNRWRNEMVKKTSLHKTVKETSLSEFQQ